MCHQLSEAEICVDRERKVQFDIGGERIGVGLPEIDRGKIVDDTDFVVNRH